MNPGADVQAIDALQDWHNAVALFRERATAARPGFRSTWRIRLVHDILQSPVLLPQVTVNESNR